MRKNIIVTMIILLLSNLSIGQIETNFNKKQIKEKLPFSTFAKIYVDEQIKKWETKDEFEKTSDWQLRVNEETSDQKRETLFEDAIEAYAERLNIKLGFCYIGASLSLGPYDADKEVYIIKSRYFGDLHLPVPFEEAEKFKNQNWCINDSKPTNVVYYIINDELGLAQAIFWDKYKYENPLAKNRNKTKKEIAHESLSQAKTLYNNKEYENSVTFFQKSAELNPDILYKKDYCDFGEACFQIGNYHQVIECYNKFLKSCSYIDSRYNEITGEFNIYNLATSYLILKEYSNAIETYYKYLNGNRNAKIYNNIAESYNGLGNYEKAIEILNYAIDLEPHFAQTYLNLGNTYKLMGSKKEAIKNYKISAKLGNKDAQSILKEPVKEK